MADAAVQSALRALDTPSLPRRPLTQPPNSLLWVDACTLVDEATLRAAVPGLDTGRRDKTEGGWSCEWGGGMAVADPPTVDVFIARVPPPASRVDASSGDSATTIGGRSALVEPGLWSLTPRLRPFCRVEVPQRSFQGTYDRPEVEEVPVDVHLTVATPSEAQCAAATTIAQAIVAKLPPAS